MVKMDLTEDFCKIQGLFTSIHASIGDFSSIRYASGNEEKITRIVGDLKHWLNKKKYFCDNMINYSRETSVRKLVLLFILNTELKNQSLFDIKVSHLIGLIPKFSKFLLTTIIFDLNLYEFYAETITCLPADIGLELLENCDKYIAKADPYLILKQTSVIAQSVYFKIYHMRYERNDKLDSLSVKLLDKFMGILKNYITPVTEKLLNWPTDKMYQYIGKSIYEILILIKTCFSTFEMKEFVIPYYQFYQFSSEINHPLIDSPIALNKCNETLKECNKNLISVCEANISAVSLDVFCSWVECKQDNLTLQQAIRTLAYDVNQQLKLFEDPGDLPQMLESIAIKPTPIEDIIKDADEATLLQNVVIENENQLKWFKALINYGIFHSEEIFNIFKTVVHLSDKEDLINLLCLNNSNIKIEFDFINFIIQYLHDLPETDCINIIGEYFSKCGTNNYYESSGYNKNLQEFFNKLKCGGKIEISLKEISILVLQNPIKFINHLLEESEKNLDHLNNIIYMFNFIRPVCNIVSTNENTILSNCIIQKLNECQLGDSKRENCIIQLVVQLIKNELLYKQIFEQFRLKFNENRINHNFERATFYCRLCKENLSIIEKTSIIPVLLEFNSIVNEVRWKMFSYSQDKCVLLTEVIQFIYELKNNLPIELQDDFNNALNSIDENVDSYYLHRDESINFLTYVYPDYDKSAESHDQIAQLMKLLPCCVPLEWDLIAKYLMEDNDGISLLKLYIDFLLVLSVMSKDVPDNYLTLSYCFQQVCIIIKDIIEPAIKQNKDVELEKTFIKNICLLLKHLPKELYNTEVSLVNLFDFDVLNSLKDDPDFLATLISMSELEICKSICSKLSA